MIWVAPQGWLALHRECDIPLPDAELRGFLVVPRNALGLIVFAHGSGSGRHSPRNQAVARSLQETGFATLLFDLLTPEESGDRALVFDISLLARRLAGAVAWARDSRSTIGLTVGLFGASTGGAAAILAAADDREIAAVVSRGGRPDLAGDALERLGAPTLLIVGAEDRQVLALNREAAARMRCPHQLEIVEGATHLFEEPGALETVADLAGHWFVRHMGDADERIAL